MGFGMDRSALKIGFIGLGLMGAPMTLRLLGGGYRMHVWNRSAEKLKPLIEAGAVAEDSIAELAKECQIIMLCLSNTEAVEQVVFGDGGVITQGSAEKLLVDFSSIDPVSTQIFSWRLNEACGMRWVDAPVSGGVAGAESGELIVMAGGAADDIERLAPILKLLSTRVTHMGAVGAGQITKLCNQMIVGCNAVVIGEMMALARRAGVAVEKLPGALAGGFADSKPLQILGPQMAASDFTLKWHVKTVLKDLQGARKLSAAVHSETPMLALGENLIRKHGEQGYMDQDLSTLILAHEQAVAGKK